MSKIKLKVISSSDLPKLHEWKNDFDLCHLIKVHPLPVIFEDVERWFSTNYSDKNQVLLGIYSNETNLIIGIVRLMFIDWISAVTEFGMFIGDKNSRGIGIGTEVMKKIIDYAFRSLNLRKIFLKVIMDNLAAIKLYKSVGFNEEGVLKKHYWGDGKYVDVLVMSLFNINHAK